jgi:hypothetical protein
LGAALRHILHFEAAFGAAISPSCDTKATVTNLILIRHLIAKIEW